MEMGLVIEVKDLSFQYPDQAVMALSQIDLKINDGEFVVICGPSGCGKSTLLRLLKQETQPYGSIKGEIRYNNVLLHQVSALDAVQQVALVWQDPENQIVMEQVQEELVFALENLGYPSEVIRKRLAEMVQFFGLEALLSQRTDELSGGQKQLLNLASVLLLQPKVLLLDEPTAQLDPVSGREFIQILKRINEEFGMTIVLVEHRLDEVFSVADRVIMMDAAEIHYEGRPENVIYKVWKLRDKRFLPYIPSIARIYLHFTEEYLADEIPFSVKDGRRWLSKQGVRAMGHGDKPEQLRKHPIIHIQSADFRYAKESPLILKDLDMQVYSGDFLAIVGGNGTGKSTLLKLLGGLLTPQTGRVLVNGNNVKKWKKEELYRKVGYLPQNPLVYFSYDTVKQELEFAANRFSNQDKLDQMIKQLELTHLLHRHPHDCSGGERQKVVLACILLGNPEVLLLDEPTKGMDPVLQKTFANMIEDLHKQGVTIVMVTHHVEFAARYVSRCAMLFDGKITTEGPPSTFFSNNFFYTTNVNRMSREWFPNSLTDEEVIKLWPVLG
ncbi:ABC transporter ATP-binding protein [Ammoniphilus sp. CFH 90114]|uniref:ABC transporter ATP-binding protein n=1 Tax=Ammoniphilus sp. CFH 90114 TaxID=2493665 RepID=UPI00100DD36E|nr:ABC transporter ATP-binding protein [Ammoniphilus sp. CFH 90114]RXT06465.1 ABC transporter ATP-binding protein [Ammoniphilus sp. CFH 90114]